MMIRKFLCLLAIFMFSAMSAQNDEIFSNDPNSGSNQKQNYMQEAGSRTLELSFNPGNIFGSSSGNAFSLINGIIKYRHFSSATKAGRYGIGFTLFKDVDIIQQEDKDLNLLELRSTSSVYGIKFMPGVETHFQVSDKISPYVGFQALLGYTATSYSEEYQDNNKVYVATLTNSDNGAGMGSLDIGVGLLSGVDYYFVKHFYVGVELGVGAKYSKKLSTKLTDSQDSSNNREIKNGYQIILAPGLTTGNLRLGWTF